MNNLSSLQSMPSYYQLPEGDDPGVERPTIQMLEQPEPLRLGELSPGPSKRSLLGVPSDCRDGQGPGGRDHQFGPPPGGTSAPMVPVA